MSAIETGYVLTGHIGLKEGYDGKLRDGWVSSKCNSAGGIGCRHDIYNATDKVIKYVTVTYLAYNPVDDVVKCQTTGRTEASGKLTGPIQPQEECSLEWDVLWYNPTITKVKIKEMIVQYMDDTEEIIPGSELVSMYNSESEYQKQKEARKAAEEAEKAAKKAADDARRQQQKEEAKQAVNALKDSVVGGLKGLFKKK